LNYFVIYYKKKFVKVFIFQTNILMDLSEILFAKGKKLEEQQDYCAAVKWFYHWKSISI